MNKAWDGMGITLGNFSTQSGWTQQRSLDWLKANGIMKMRFLYDPNNASWKARALTAIAYAKSIGMYVLSGWASTGTLTTTSYPIYRALVLSELPTLVALGVDEICVDNEGELRIDGVTIVDPFALVSSHYKPLATAVRATGFAGPISFAISGGAQSWIYGISKGDFTHVGFNEYGETTAGTFTKFRDRILEFKANAIWGPTLQIHEFNTTYDDAVSVARITKPNFYTREVAKRLKAIQDAGITTAYFFCFRYDTRNYHSILQDDGGIGAWANPLITNNRSQKVINSIT